MDGEVDLDGFFVSPGVGRLVVGRGLTKRTYITDLGRIDVGDVFLVVRNKDTSAPDLCQRKGTISACLICPLTSSNCGANLLRSSLDTLPWPE